MKISIACLATFLIYQSCQTKLQQSKELKEFFNKCDELDIMFYAKDTFVFKTFDTSTINNFTELISGDDNSELPNSTEKPEEQLIYKSRGKIFFIADVINHYDKKGILSNYVTYTLQQKKCKHLLTYRTGMGIDEIYWHKVDPKGNPWTNADISKFHYEEIKNNR